MSNVLVANQLCRSFDEAERQLIIINDLNLSVAAGERVAIIGSSGSGKSTLLNLLAGLDTPTAGEVVIAGESISQLSENRRAELRNSQLGFVFQFHHLLPEFSALENIAIPQLLGGVSVDAAQQRAAYLLDQVGLSSRAQHKPAKLSGGERQRVAIARALANTPACVLMDEPTGNLDPHTAEDVEQYLLKLNQEQGVAQIVVTHDHDLAKRMDRVLELKEGGLVEVFASTSL
ncbi:Lipoprotein-releasing system ATP-binding protein LolD [Marinobacterium sp. xm-a-121]|uniref:ABC transporter ATP-binding protein n=1 Tax=unclassified Marinobacterium TaxID=2644139 RepID=UPI0015691925|nr:MULTISPECIES: ATP-binding cassette domain-containing protein [unclassified Marinobacterium]NRP38755.1 Lipoprotein-releasing system ATP-binding protein LolD [Marinobacterium sp. xm-a-121]NRP47801.1 Lipoprotein-releasing system ATP-binding protein LolD [Marinobacterium sp. xm-d-543]NRP99571.1 Lipoprotein-releasing system ATP-binding protein LolD [Marinobacterium sp. xm-v-233]NRQ24040.1 Lipoprotein-releasing system ATP-binding protein LolD [Marinobacterium sp. xm-m-312]